MESLLNDNPNLDANLDKRELNLIPGSFVNPELAKEAGRVKTPLKAVTAKLNGMKTKKCDKCKHQEACNHYKKGNTCSLPSHLFKMLSVFSSVENIRNEATKDAVDMYMTKELYKNKMKEYSHEPKEQAKMYKDRYYIDRDFFELKTGFAQWLFGDKREINVTGDLTLANALDVAFKTEQKLNQRKKKQEDKDAKVQT